MKPTAGKLGTLIVLSLLAAGCSTVQPAPSRDAYNDYVPHKDIGAPAGSPENPDTGWNSLIVSLLETVLPPK